MIISTQSEELKLWRILFNVNPLNLLQNNSLQVTNSTSTEIPLHFSSRRQYITTIEPLIISECYAELAQALEYQDQQELQYFQLEISQRRQSEKQIDRHGVVDNVMLITFTSPNSSHISFKTGDVLLLTPTELKTETSSSVMLFGIIEHINNIDNDIHVAVCPPKTKSWGKIAQKKLLEYVHWRVASTKFATGPYARMIRALHCIGDTSLHKTILNPSAYAHEYKSSLHRVSPAIRQYLTNSFNSSQIQAIGATSTTRENFTLIMGPPGTGKTTMLLGILSIVLQQNPRAKILISAPTNVAVDEIILRIWKQGLVDKRGERYGPKIVRLGIEDRMPDKIRRKAYLDTLVKHQVRKEVERQEKSGDIRLCKSEIRQIETRVKKDILNSSNIICSTLSTASLSDPVVQNIRFDLVCIDEACQAIEPLSLIPLVFFHAKHCVMTGDPNQLPATLISSHASSAGLDRSLMERLIRAKFPTIMLNIQYRMHPDISRFPVSYFYENKLNDDPSTEYRATEYCETLGPYAFLDCITGKEKKKHNSLHNTYEANLVSLLCQGVINNFGSDRDKKRVSSQIVVLTPYRKQLSTIKNHLKRQEKYCQYLPAIQVYTIDGFQGNESEIIILSCVRSSNQRGIGFVQDVRRMNVALTRAQHQLIVLGNSETLSKNKAWSDLIEDSKIRGCYHVVSGNCSAFVRRNIETSQPKYLKRKNTHQITSKKTSTSNTINTVPNPTSDSVPIIDLTYSPPKKRETKLLPLSEEKNISEQKISTLSKPNSLKATPSSSPNSMKRPFSKLAQAALDKNFVPPKKKVSKRKKPSSGGSIPNERENRVTQRSLSSSSSSKFSNKDWRQHQAFVLNVQKRNKKK
eukprot:gb/GECH01009765.1/.p1 GENE.gb/GECH01009765.1/~~gb/GECH01009765.1/.p1  ORF type:complete len:861 (+),score=178.79 gb/GECH01009765.1/:1-2583(+)